jgi:2-amino-4-hydroxy-6-hydroxymethyldihydropteridine diphosphokinase
VIVAYLSLGSNLGDRLALLQRAVEALTERGVHVLASSRVWETEPIETDLEPRAVLEAGHEVEAALGRTREVRWGPRTIDVDVLMYGNIQMNEPDLTIPHPRMTDRAFVLLPLLDLDPDPRLSGGRRVLDLPSPEGEARPYAAPLET